MSESPALTERQLEAIKAFEGLPAWTGARMVPVSSLEFTSWNVNEMTPQEFSELVAEIDAASYTLPGGEKVPGFDEPVAIIPIEGEPDRYIVPSGEHRTRAAIACELTHIPCVLKVHLTEMDRDELEMWSVKRNNVRGRINAQRYAALEQGWSQRKGIRAEAARERLLVKGETLKRLRKTTAVQLNEEGGGSEAMGGEGRKKGSQLPKTGGPEMTADDVTPYLGEGRTCARDGDSDGGAGDPDQADRSSPPAKRAVNPKEEARQRKKLEADFKAAWEEVLLDSGDTVEHGYLVFAKDGKTSVVLDQPAHLHSLVCRVVEACKNDSGKLSEFLTTAITRELPNWEER